MKIKFYKAGIACASLASKSLKSEYASVIPYKDTSGTTRDMLWLAESWAYSTMNNLSLYRSLTPLASSEAESDFDLDTYSITSTDIFNTTITMNEVENISSKDTSMDITNNESSSITIKSIKFYKNLNMNVSTYHSALVYVIYLDDPVTIQPGETKSVIVKFAFYNPPSVS